MLLKYFGIVCAQISVKYLVSEVTYICNASARCWQPSLVTRRGFTRVELINGLRGLFQCPSITASGKCCLRSGNRTSRIPNFCACARTFACGAGCAYSVRTKLLELCKVRVNDAQQMRVRLERLEHGLRLFARLVCLAQT